MQQGAVALLVVLFHCGHQAEARGQLREALFLGGFGKTLVHIRPLIVLPLGGSEKILSSVADPVQLLKPELSMLLLVLGGLEKQSSDLLIALFLRLGGKIGVLIAGFGFPGKGGHQIFLGLRSGVFGLFHENMLLSIDSLNEFS